MLWRDDEKQNLEEKQENKLDIQSIFFCSPKFYVLSEKINNKL